MSNQEQEINELKRALTLDRRPVDAIWLDAGYVVIERDPATVSRVAVETLGRQWSDDQVHAAIIEAQRAFYQHVSLHGFPDRFGDDIDAIPPLLRSEYARLLASLVGDDAFDLAGASAKRFFAGIWDVESKGELYVKMMNPSFNAIIARIRATGIKIVVVSNASALLHHMFDLAGVDQTLFNAILASEVIGIKKPDWGIFQRAEQAVGVSADRAVFIDDAPAYLGPVRDRVRCIRFDPYRIQPDALPEVPVCTDLGILADVLCR